MLICEAEGYDADIAVSWVKDKVMAVGTGPVLSITPKPAAEIAVIHDNLEGHYHCEVWGIRPYQRLQSEEVLVKFSGKLNADFAKMLKCILFCRCSDCSGFPHH
jgi:hypothetical protein